MMHGSLLIASPLCTPLEEHHIFGPALGSLRCMFESTPQHEPLHAWTKEWWENNVEVDPPLVLQGFIN